MNKTFTKEFIIKYFEGKRFHNENKSFHFAKVNIDETDESSFINKDIITIRDIVDSDLPMQAKYDFVIRNTDLTLLQKQRIIISIALHLYYTAIQLFENDKTVRETILASGAYVNGTITHYELLLKRYAADDATESADTWAHRSVNSHHPYDMIIYETTNLAYITTYAAENIAFAGCKDINDLTKTAAGIAAVVHSHFLDVQEMRNKYLVSSKNIINELKKILEEYLND